MKLKLNKDGSVSLSQNTLVFDSENQTANVILEYPEQYEDWDKRTDIVTSKNETTFKVGDTFTLDNSVLKKGYISLQPIAYKGDKVKKWCIVTIEVKRSLNVIEDDTTVTVSVASELYDLVNTKADEIHTHDISDLRGFNGATWLNLDTLLRAIKE